MKSLPFHNLSVNIGSNQSENCTLYDSAQDDDIWLHVDGGSSAHLWIQKSQHHIPGKLFRKIALLFKQHHKKYRYCNFIDIIYTQKKNLSKTTTKGLFIVNGPSKRIRV